MNLGVLASYAIVYWADPSTGFILKSRQYLAPDYAVDMVQLKPYRKAQD